MKLILLALMMTLAACAKTESQPAPYVNALGASYCDGNQIGSWTDAVGRPYEIKTNCTIEMSACATTASYTQPDEQGAFQLLVNDFQGGQCSEPGKFSCALAFPAKGLGNVMYFTCGGSVQQLDRVTAHKYP